MFTTMCPKEQQTSDNLFVKDYCFILNMLKYYCFIIEIFDKGPVKLIQRVRNSSLIFDWKGESS